MSLITSISGMVSTVVALCTVLCLMLTMLFLTARMLFNRRRNRNADETGGSPSVRPSKTIAFFHPYCNAGGGGERVLWCAIRALQNKYDNVKIVVFTGDLDATPAEIISKARERFNVQLPREVTFVYLTCRKWIEAGTYPHFTLLGQSVGSMLLGLEALTKCVPDVYLDSMGYAFTLPIFRYLGGCSVGCYVHYPIVSTDMLRKVADARAAHNRLFTSAKIVYYRMFAFFYGLAGSAAQVVMVNSSWTRQHILQLWKCPAITFRVYPPCDVTGFQTISLERRRPDHLRDQLSIVSVSQFRPEKDHRLQICAFQQLLTNVGDRFGDRLRLKLIGSCRNAEDEERVAELAKLAGKLAISDKVDFQLNVSFEELKGHLENAVVGLHTMWNEHFGIGVVECMAAGLVMLAHDSGGPKMDIVVDYNGRKTGYLASDVHGFAVAMETILELSESERDEIRRNARRSTARFSDYAFECNFLHLFHTFFLPTTTATPVSPSDF